MSVEAVTALARSRPGWEVVVMEGVGHPVLEAPERAAETITRWLDARDEGS